MYWGSVTSSVDFCETNYSLSFYIAEPANAISSLFFVFLGLVGLLRVNKLRGETPQTSLWSDRLFGLMYFLLIIIGIGSVALHSCLCAWGQAMDEVPMLLMVVAIMAALLEKDCIGSRLSRPWLPYAAGSVACIEVIIYAFLQELYVVFLVMYISSVVVIVYWQGSLALTKRENVHNEKIRINVIKPLYFAAIMSYIGCGSFAWSTDFLLCTKISSLGWFAPMVLHPVWHIGAGMGSWLAIQQIAASRAEALRVDPVVVWWNNVLPYVTYVKYC
jgi:dihydroceramidase